MMTRPSPTVAVVAACVLLLHVAALWALHLGLVTRKPDIVLPVHLLARIVEPPKPIAPKPQPLVTQHANVPKPSPPAPKPRAVRPKPAPVSKPALPPRPLPPPVQAATPLPIIAEPTPIPVAPAATSTSAVSRPSSLSVNKTQTDNPPTAVANAPTTPAPRPAPMPIELPSSDAQYLQNPRPRYPPISLRLREQGTVMVDVLVSDLGLANEARIKTSSGFFRLDNAAMSTVLTWRFVPGKRAGVAQSMWFTVPIVFAIQ